jgi:hypothetical protein
MKSLFLTTIIFIIIFVIITLRKEHRLKAFENKELRRSLYLREREEVGGWRKLHNEELRNLYF